MSLKDNSPLVSVVMPVYNVGSFIVESIESIRNQTYENWELIIVDDASTDNTLQVAKSISKIDKRIKVYSNSRQFGVSKSANIAISKVKGMFVARMDGDDVSLLSRFQKQVNFLLKHPDVVAVGGQCRLINAEGKIFGKKMFPTKFNDIKDMIFRNVPLQQPALMVNFSKLPPKFVWYNDEYRSAEEIELIFKLFMFGEVNNLPNFVLKYRIHNQNTSFLNPKKTFYLTLKTRINAIKRYKHIPSIENMLINLLQIVFVIIVPKSLIYPIYMHLRGMKKISRRSVKINTNVLKQFEKTYQFAGS